AGGDVLDASGFAGIELDVCGNGEEYDLRLRTDALLRPWQSFRSSFTAPPEWTSVRVPFGDIVPHKTEAAFDPARLRRIGVLAIGREFHADIAVAGLRFYP
ncbi:MAG: CIA30 family protein, partial [Octadecabacter sp.]|nr:CIA30 family protein [Octadecabacter sp.]